MDFVWQMVLSLNYDTKEGNESAPLQQIRPGGVEGRGAEGGQAGVLSTGPWLFLTVAGAQE